MDWQRILSALQSVWEALNVTKWLCYPCYALREASPTTANHNHPRGESQANNAFTFGFPLRGD